MAKKEKHPRVLSLLEMSRSENSKGIKDVDFFLVPDGFRVGDNEKKEEKKKKEKKDLLEQGKDVLKDKGKRRRILLQQVLDET